MLTGFLAFLNLIPGIGNVITAFFNSKAAVQVAQVNADATVTAALVQGQVAAGAQAVGKLQAYGANKILSFILLSFAFPTALYYGKVVAFDNIWCPYWLGHTCVTQPIHGDVASYMGLIISFLFGVPSVVSLANMYFNRRR